MQWNIRYNINIYIHCYNKYSPAVIRYHTFEMDLCASLPGEAMNFSVNELGADPRRKLIKNQTNLFVAAKRGDVEKAKAGIPIFLRKMIKNDIDGGRIPDPWACGVLQTCWCVATHWCPCPCTLYPPRFDLDRSWLRPMALMSTIKMRTDRPVPRHVKAGLQTLRSEVNWG